MPFYLERFALATLKKLLLMGGIQHFCRALLVEICCWSSVDLTAAAGLWPLIWQHHAQKWPLEMVKRHENRGLARSPPKNRFRPLQSVNKTA
jgi:hypothetical protein